MDSETVSIGHYWLTDWQYKNIKNKNIYINIKISLTVLVAMSRVMIVEKSLTLKPSCICLNVIFEKITKSCKTV